MTPPEQLPLPLPVRTALGREDYFVSEANAVAVALIEDWQAWPARKFVLTGPEGAGKTHLAHVWAAQSGATVVAAEALPGADIAALANAPVCVEDVDRIAGDRPAEEALFHLHNMTLANGHALLLSARKPPAQWALGLADLQSRVMGAQGATLDDPDDALLGALLGKLFADRHILPARDVIPYLVRWMPRSYAMAHRVVAALDRAALGQGRGVKRPLAVATLAELGATGLAEPGGEGQI